MHKVHQHLLHPVEYAHDRILLHGIKVAVVERGIVESHYASLAVDHRDNLIVHQCGNLRFQQVALYAFHAIECTVLLAACSLSHVGCLVVELSAECCRRSYIESLGIFLVARHLLGFSAYNPVGTHHHVHQFLVAVAVALGVGLQVIERILVGMVGEQHHLIFKCKLGPSQQVYLVGEHCSRYADEAVGIFQAQTVEAVAQQVLHFLVEARVGIGYVFLHYVDDAEVLHLVCTAGLEERVELAV